MSQSVCCVRTPGLKRSYITAVGLATLRTHCHSGVLGLCSVVYIYTSLVYEGEVWKYRASSDLRLDFSRRSDGEAAASRVFSQRVSIHDGEARDSK